MSEYCTHNKVAKTLMLEKKTLMLENKCSLVLKNVYIIRILHLLSM